MRLLLRTPWLWFAATAMTTIAMLGVAGWRDEPQAQVWIGLSVAVSLATLVASSLTVWAAGACNKPLYRMLIETCLRVALPMGVLLAVVFAGRDLFSSAFLLYFLPFQLVTIFVGMAAAVRDVER